mmetsp:Transcript_11845/g.21116  ORF Transcript_11845/g.21116 Transcript_11845/m.21116 type:complete len:390 (-) Transcript_11845:257-1426(-)
MVDVMEEKMARVLERVQQVLDTNRAPVLPSKAAHTYQDKFLMVERAGNSGLGALQYLLGVLGLDQAKTDLLQEWSKSGSAITLQFEADFKCHFLRTTESQEESPQKQVVEGLKEEAIASEVATTITEVSALLDMVKAEREEELELEKQRAIESGAASVKPFWEAGDSSHSKSVFGNSSHAKSGFGTSSISLETAQCRGGGGGGSPGDHPNLTSPRAQFGSSASNQVQRDSNNTNALNSQASPVKNNEISFESRGQDESEIGRVSGYTSVPKKLDAAFQAGPHAASCLLTKLSVEEAGELQRYKSLLAQKPKTSLLGATALKQSRSKAMDLLDALSRSGELALVQSQLHVFYATTLSFDQMVLDLLIQKNANPIKVMEDTARRILAAIES